MSEYLKYDHYKVLGVYPWASRIQIKQAYRKKVKDYHPDVNHSPNASVAFNALQDAYETLLNPEKRRVYDEQLKNYRFTNTTQAKIRIFKQRRQSLEEEPASYSFVALHMVGILFSITVGMRCAIGLAFEAWPLYTLLYCIPVVLLLPDAISGFRTAIKSRG